MWGSYCSGEKAMSHERCDDRNAEVGSDSRTVRRPSLQDVLADWVLEGGKESQG